MPLLGVVGNLLTLAQAPSFLIQAIYGTMILGSLVIAAPPEDGRRSKLRVVRLMRIRE